jgi:hypothetical protein
MPADYRCEWARAGRVCWDDLCQSAADETLCGAALTALGAIDMGEDDEDAEP